MIVTILVNGSQHALFTSRSEADIEIGRMLEAAASQPAGSRYVEIELCRNGRVVWFARELWPIVQTDPSIQTFSFS